VAAICFDPIRAQIRQTRDPLEPTGLVRVEAKKIEKKSVLYPTRPTRHNPCPTRSGNKTRETRESNPSDPTHFSHPTRPKPAEIEKNSKK
jgi:hypothetical protein